MKRAEAKKRVVELRREIEHHNRCYYVLNQPEVSDREYDALLKELEDLEKRFPGLVSPYSPTQRVGVPVEGPFAPVRHLERMLSMDNTYNEDDLREFEKRLRRLLKGEEIEYVVEPKVDGASISLRYEKGLLVSGATRGDGRTGEDVTSNVKTIRSLPLRLRGRRLPELFEVRGEIYIGKRRFVEINRSREERGLETYANPRNLAAGSLKQLDPRVCAGRRLGSWIYAATSPEALGCETQAALLKKLEKLGFRVDPSRGVCRSIEEVIDFCKMWERRKAGLDFVVDGMVVKVNDFRQQKRLGETSKAPRWQIAYKFPAEQATSRVEDIVVQVGRLGTLTPVALLEPVRLSGTTVRRATLHNEDEIRRKGVRIGDRVVVEKAGEIIPQVVKAVAGVRTGKEREFRMPKVCPACGGPVRREEGEVALRCENIACPAQLRERIRHFASRGAMDIEHLGTKLIHQLVERGLLGDIGDIYALSMDDLLPIERMAKKSAENLLKAIGESRGRPLRRLLHAIGIRHVGASVAALLAAAYGDLDRLGAAGVEDLQGIEGIGPTVADSVVRFFRNPRNRSVIDKLEKAGVRTKTERASSTSDGRFAGKTFVFTGALRTFTRQEAEAVVRERGGKASASVSTKTDFVVVGENPGSKARKAKELGVKILSEAELKKMIQ